MLGSNPANWTPNASLKASPSLSERLNAPTLLPEVLYVCLRQIFVLAIPVIGDGQREKEQERRTRTLET